jgi:hypothetical protein
MVLSLDETIDGISPRSTLEATRNKISPKSKRATYAFIGFQFLENLKKYVLDS